MVAIVCAALPANWLFGAWLTYQDHKAALVRLQHEQATAAAAAIGQFLKEIEGHMGWLTQLPWGALRPEERAFDAHRLLRQAPAVVELALLDATGREQLRVSRIAIDVAGTDADFSGEPAFVEALARGVYYGPVYFRRGSEPYLTLSVAGPQREGGVAVAQVNLLFVWEAISRIRVGRNGRAYVVDATGRLIAHPDIGLVLRNTDFSGLEQVRAAGSGAPAEAAARDAQGHRVLTSHAPVTALGWQVFVELPLDEAYAPVYASLGATGLALLGALMIAVVASLVLARRMVRPILLLQDGAARIGSGTLGHRINIRTGDELEALGEQFNRMAAQLQESYATLEAKVDERTRQLELANLAKSRFLAAASHDLRQPLHALNLFVAQLQQTLSAHERGRVTARIDAAVTAMNELFDALLDISKLDAGVLAPAISELPVAQVLKRIETTFAAAAREKGLRLRVVPTRIWVRSDFILLERILLNLVSNAVRYSDRGGIVVGCRRRGERAHIEVWDSGIGVPEDQQRNIFGEFYRLAGSGAERQGGLGLGLAIVERLCALLEHPLQVRSAPGKGSCFAVSLPVLSQQPRRTEASTAHAATSDVATGRLVLVVDDDMLVRDGMRGLLQSWGCRVVTAASASDALLRLRGQHPPDLIICDYRLANGTTGVDLVRGLQAALESPVPAFLMTGDTAPEPLREASASGFHLVHKPVSAMALRAMVNRFLRLDHPSLRLSAPLPESDPSAARLPQ